MASYPIDGDPATAIGPLIVGFATHGTARQGFAITATGGSGTATIVKYLMRGNSVSLGRNVYWYATTVDLTAAEYTEAGAPITDIHLIKRAL